MIILEYSKKHHPKIIHACVLALKQGSVVAYPTDTSYGLAVDATNASAVKKLYQTKGRDFNKPSSVVTPSIKEAKKFVNWNNAAEVLVKKFWPGALTVALEIREKVRGMKRITSKDGYLSLRMPDSKIALDLSASLKNPITATSANLSDMPDCYSAEDIIRQFKNQKLKPDIIINFGKLKKQKPSTVVKVINEHKIEIVRVGPITENAIIKALQKNLKS